VGCAARIAFWGLIAATVALYALMIFWSIPRISAAALGLAVFDMRPSGYDLDAARGFLAALSPEGRDFYLRVQHRLDLAYPLLLALACAWSILRLAPSGWGAWRGLMALPAFLGMAFDYLENRAVAGLLHAGADGTTAAMVAEASRFSQAKAAFNTITLTTLLALILVRVTQRLRARRGRSR
jgi:hypothetical protein